MKQDMYFFSSMQIKIQSKKILGLLLFIERVGFKSYSTGLLRKWMVGVTAEI